MSEWTAILLLVGALAAAVKGVEVLARRGIRGFRALRRLGRALNTLYEIAEEFKPDDSDSLRDQIDGITDAVLLNASVQGRIVDRLDTQSATLDKQSAVINHIAEACPLMQGPHLHR